MLIYFSKTINFISCFVNIFRSDRPWDSDWIKNSIDPNWRLLFIFRNKHAVGNHGRMHSFSPKMRQMLNYIEYWVECMYKFSKLWIRMDSLQFPIVYQILNTKNIQKDSNLTLNIWYKSEIIIHHHFWTDFVDFSSSSIELDSDCNFGMINWKEMKHSQITVWYNVEWMCF